MRIYLAVLHRSHFPLKHLHFSSPKLVLLQLASKLSKSLCLHSYFISNLNIFFLQKWHNKLTLTSVMAWWEKDNSDFPQKFAGSSKYGLRARDHRLLLHSAKYVKVEKLSNTHNLPGKFYMQFPKICLYIRAYFLVCVLCVCISHVICVQNGGFTCKKQAYHAEIPVACTVHVTSWLIVFKPHFSNQVHKGVL